MIEKKFLDIIDKNISRHITLNEDEIALFHSLLKINKIKKKHFLYKEGDFCRESIFVVEGCLRSYMIDKNGFEHILSFAPVDWWMGDLYSYFTGKPSILYVQAIEDTQILSFTKESQDILYQEIPKFERYFRILIERSLIANQQRVLNNMSMTAEERFIYFCQKYPNLLQTIQQKYIASFLGVTPEFFSKMRSKYLREQK